MKNYPLISDQVEKGRKGDGETGRQGEARI